MTIRELEKLIYEYGKDILSFCIHLTGNISEGEELYQEVFLKQILWQTHLKKKMQLK